MKKEYNNIADIQKRIKHIEKFIDKLYEEQTNLNNKLSDICTCEFENLVYKSDYHEGGYYDKSYYENYDQCKICGKKHNLTKHIGWYA